MPGALWALDDGRRERLPTRHVGADDPLRPQRSISPASLRPNEGDPSLRLGMTGRGGGCRPSEIPVAWLSAREGSPSTRDGQTLGEILR